MKFIKLKDRNKTRLNLETVASYHKGDNIYPPFYIHTNNLSYAYDDIETRDKDFEKLDKFLLMGDK